MQRPLVLASLLGFAFLSACTTTTQGAPHPVDSIETTTSSSAPRPSASAPRTSSSAPRTSSNEDPDEPKVRDLAERYVEAVNKTDETTIAQLSCAKAAPGLLQIAASGQQVTMTGKLERAPVEERYYVELTIGGRPAPHMAIILKDGAWCVRD